MMNVAFRINPPLDDSALNDLFSRAWPDHVARSYQGVLARSLGYIGAFMDERLIGFVNLATDGGEHAFLLDPTVDAAYRRRGIGLELVRRAAALARERGCMWLHVDYVPELASFYEAADNSVDSRYYGPVPRENLRGTPMFVYYSYDPETGLDYIRALTAIRWNRIGHRIR